MLIRKLELNNFGVFEGHTKFPLMSDEQGKPLVIIYGKNGAGKTTILEAIKIALYGSQIIGAKTATETYLRQISGRLNRRIAATEPSSQYSVSLTLSLSEQGTSSEYTITRQWRYANPSQLREQLNVVRNGKQLKSKEVIDFEDYIRRFIPLGAFDMFFLDGERLKELFDGDRFTHDIGKALLPLCGLDVYQFLNKDLDSYLKSENTFDKLDDDQQLYQVKLGAHNALVDKIAKLEQEKNSLQDELVVIESNRLAFESELRSHGVRDATNHQERLALLELQRKTLNDEIRNVVADMLPFIIARPLLSKVVTQINSEETLLTAQRMKQHLASDKARHHVIHALGRDTYNSTDMIDKVLMALADAPIAEDLEIIHGLSREQTALISGLWSQISHSTPGLAFDEIAATTQEISQLRREKSLVEDIEISRLLESIKTMTAKASELTKRIEDIDNELAELDIAEISARLESDKAAEAVFRAKRDENIFSISHRIKGVIGDFLKLVISDYSNQLAHRTVFHLQNMLRKQHFVSRLEVRPDTLQLLLFDNEDREVDPLGLSAGEKQLLLLSAIRSLLEISGREFPLVFDTFIGRLDSTHKHNVLTGTLPKINEQVILLATDTEIDSADYEALKPYTSKVITLNYLDDCGRTKVTEGYPYEL